ncbi:unnamed protein product [Larinioides sclopetarius]|uniref:Uncharacterized protein n=1 Tax=Larinioides sclopetarius TaxID=280406 RepID=A0AAV2BFC2_9ARAC
MGSHGLDGSQKYSGTDSLYTNGLNEKDLFKSECSNSRWSGEICKVLFSFCWR